MAKGKARAFGQHLMRGEHVVGNGKKRNLTWHGGKSEASQKVLLAGSKRANVAKAIGNAATVGGGGAFTDQTVGTRNKRANAIPGGGLGSNSVYQFRQADGSFATGEEAQAQGTGTSIFDPVLCELAYRWFCPPNGRVLDPFAGGSVRGIVASKLGRRYTGVDLRPEQVSANEAQAKAICDEALLPVWITGDSRDELDILASEAAEYEFIFSCPPYGDLEVYSEDERDLSTMDFAAFLGAYRLIVGKACALLRPNSFACFVVGDFRDKEGFYRSFPAETVRAFEEAGVRLYNQAILVTAAGSLPVRAGKQFASTRKLGNTHQHVLVFCKGDPRKATAAVGEVEFGEIEVEVQDGSAHRPAGMATDSSRDAAEQFGEIL